MTWVSRRRHLCQAGSRTLCGLDSRKAKTTKRLWLTSCDQCMEVYCMLLIVGQADADWLAEQEERIVGLYPAERSSR